MWLYGVWHNGWKPRRIGSPDRRTHVEWAGVRAPVLEAMRQRFFTRRAFFTHLDLSVSGWRSWVRGWATPGRLTAPKVWAYILD